MNSSNKRATIYFDEDTHRALKLKSAETDQSISEIANEAVQLLLQEDYEDIRDIRKRKSEPTVSYEDVLKELKTSGKI